MAASTQLPSLLPLLTNSLARFLPLGLRGSLDRSVGIAGTRFILLIATLVIVDYATRYPEAFQLISLMGIPKEVNTHQGTTFMSRTLRELLELLGIKSICSRKFVHEDAKNWDGLLEPLLCDVSKVPRTSMGISPFERLYGHQPRGLLDILRETWDNGPSNSKILIQNVLNLRTKLHNLGWLLMENLLQAHDI